MIAYTVVLILFSNTNERIRMFLASFYHKEGRKEGGI
jgi:hypothetical protein